MGVEGIEHVALCPRRGRHRLTVANIAECVGGARERAPVARARYRRQAVGEIVGVGAVDSVGTVYFLCGCFLSRR